MSCPTVLPIVVYRGRSFAPIIQLTDPCTGRPIDVTPYTEISVSVEGTTSCVTVLLSMSEVVKIAPNQAGQIQPKFSASNTLLFALTDATKASQGFFTPITVKLTDPTNPDQNPYVLVIPAASSSSGASTGALNIIDSPC